jgi:hypothetical protein
MPVAEQEMSRIVLAFAIAAAGCYSSYQVSADGDWEVRDRAEAPDARDDAGGHDDADGDAEADLPAEAEAEAGADADADGDGDADVLVEECPASLPTDGPVRLNLRWRRLAATDWTDDGSAALGEASNVILAAFPRPSSPTGEPRLVRLAADSGEPLLDGPPLIPEYAFGTALALDGQQLVGAVDMSEPTMDLNLLFARLESSGTISGEVVTRPIVLDGVPVIDLRARTDASWIYLTTKGYNGAGWVLDATTFPHSMRFAETRRLYEGSGESGAAFVAWDDGDDGDGVADTVAWTDPDGVELFTADGTSLAAWTLPTRSPFLAVAAGPAPGPSSRPYVFAGRSDDASVGIRMWIEVRRSSDLAFVSGTYLEHLESLVRRPEPRALARVGEQLVLAWAAERTFGGSEPVASCLYLTPLAASGAPAGGTMRVDPGVADAHLPGIEHVRLVVGPDGIYLLWRQDPELWVARVDSSS